MRTTKNLARRSSALVLAGALAFAGAACGDDEPETDVDVTEEGADVTEEDVDVTEESTDGAETEESTDDMSTETEESTE